MATGGELVIDPKLLRMIEKVEKQLQKTAKQAKTTDVSIKKMFQKTSLSGVDNLINKLKGLEKGLSGIASNDAKGMKRISKNAQKAADDINKVINALQRMYGRSYSSAMSYSSNAKTLAQDRESIRRLREAKEHLDRTDSNYIQKMNQLNSAISLHSNRIRQATAESGKLQNSHRGLMNTSDQLQRKLALLFSVSAISGYMNKLVAIRKEFELQYKSLGILLRDSDKADTIWNQTVALALKSPFRLKELVTYTKQLAAYRIETELLHDTTKRLADVSAGLGVDMSRLILAYGQVRAASFLRGTELRQFTEAGIPMLDELAEHFSKLEGEAVGVNQVFERISKRQVDFEDVATVFKKMTDEGGVFYKMQEEQSKTLHGMISNLHDSIDLMLNDIGQSNEGVMKSGVEVAKSLVENWRAFAYVLKIVGVSMLALQLAQFRSGWIAVSQAGAAAAAAMNGTAGAAARLRLSMTILGNTMTTLGKTLKANPILLFLSLLVSAVWTIKEYNDAVDAKNKVYDAESIKNLRKIDELERLKQKIDSNNKSIEDNKRILQDNKTTTEEQTKAKEAATKAEDDNREALAKLKKEYPDLFSAITQHKDGTLNVNKSIEEQNKLLERNIALQRMAKGGWFQDDLTTNYNELLEEHENMSAALYDFRAAAYEVRVALKDSNVFTEEQIKRIEDTLKAASKAKTFEEALKAIPVDVAFIRKLLGDEKTFGQFSDLKAMMEPLYRARDAARDINIALSTRESDLWGNLSKELNIIRDEVYKITGDEAAKERGKAIDDILKQIGFVDEQIKAWAREEIKKQVTVEVDFNYNQGGSDVVFADWQKRYNEYIKDYAPMLKEIKDPKILRDDLSKQIAEDIKSQKEIIAGYQVEGQQIYSKKDAEKAEKKLKELTRAYTWLGNAMKNTTTGATIGGGKGKDWWLEMVSGLKNLHSEFLTLRKDLDATEARTLALKKMKGVFDEILPKLGKSGKNIDLGSLNFETEQGMIDAFTYLKSLGGISKEARLAIEKALTDIHGELRITTKREDDQNLSNMVEGMFSDYELSLELEKLNIPPAIAKNLFGIDTMSLKGLRSQVEALRPKFIGTDREKEYEEYIKKVSEMENNAQLERLKKYAKYLEKSMGERVKIKKEELRQIREVEKEDKFTATQKTDILGAIKKETQDKLDKQEWKDFKDSGMYQMIFEDLEHYGLGTLNLMSDKLQDLKNSLKGLDPSQVKEIVSQIEQIENINIERNPFKELAKAKKELEKGTSLKALENEFSLLTAQKISNDEELSVIKEIQMYKSEGLTIDQTIAQVGEQHRGLVELTNEELNTRETLLKKENAQLETSLDKTAKGLKTYKKMSKAYEASMQVIQGWQTKVSELFDAITEAMEAAGVEADSDAMIFAEAAKNMVNLIFQAVQFQLQLKLIEVQAKAAKVEMNAMMGVIGWIVLALQAVTQLMSAVLGRGDKSKEKQIQALTEKVEDLQRAFEDLEEATQSAYNIDSVNSGFEAMKGNINEQIRATEQMIQLEQDKKDTDHGKIKEWQNELEDYRKQLKELEDERINQLGGIAGGDAVKSASENFVNAWIDAFRETGDGLSGLEEQFDEVFMNLVKKQVLGRGVDKMLEPLFANLDGMLKDGAMDAQEYEDFNKEWNSLSPQINEFLTKMINDLGIADDITKKTGELSGLQSGIQGITEDQADILAAYWSSVRFIVSNIEQKFTEYARQMLGSDATANPILGELKEHTRILNDIDEKLGSIIGYSGGAHVKTYLMSQ